MYAFRMPRQRYRWRGKGCNASGGLRCLAGWRGEGITGVTKRKRESASLPIRNKRGVKSVGDRRRKAHINKRSAQFALVILQAPPLSPKRKRRWILPADLMHQTLAAALFSVIGCIQPGCSARLSDENHMWWTRIAVVSFMHGGLCFRQLRSNAVCRVLYACETILGCAPEL